MFSKISGAISRLPPPVAGLIQGKGATV